MGMVVEVLQRDQTGLYFEGRADNIYLKIGCAM